MAERPTHSAQRTDPRLANVRLLTVRDVADLLAVHPRTIWRLVATGDIPAPIRLGSKAVRWRLADLERHLAKARPAR